MTSEVRQKSEGYYKAADTWANDLNAALRSSRRVAWVVATLAIIIAVAEAIALSMLMPLKTVVPYTLMVDRQTGYVQKLNPIEQERIGPDAALTQSFLVQYVIARENFDYATVQTDYRKVAIWSVESARGDYIASMQVTNPDSRLARLPRTAVLETHVRSISPLGKNTALVRFETVRRDRETSLQAPQGWAAIITYRFSDAPMSAEDRFINPLGFQVVRYKRSAESPPLPAGDSLSENEKPQSDMGKRSYTTTGLKPLP